jgi:putative spermidine/putrescine transport system permease protein
MSLQVAILVSIFTTILGTITSIGLVRARIRGKALINNFIIFPMIMPLIIISVALYSFFSKIGLYGTLPGLVLAHSIRCLPFVVITVSASLKGFDETLEKAAMICGANRFQSFMRITFPIIRPGVISGSMFAFIISFDEIVISMFMCGVETKTLPVKIWEGIRLEISPVIAAVSTLLICLSVFVLISMEFVRRQAESKIR